MTAPTVLDFALTAAGGTCGNTKDGSNVTSRTSPAAASTSAAAPPSFPKAPRPTARRAGSRSAAPARPAPSARTSTAPAVNTPTPDCTNTGCNFGTPLPIPNPTRRRPLTTCVLNTLAAPATGTLDLSSGAVVDQRPAQLRHVPHRQPGAALPAVLRRPARRPARERAPATAARARHWPAPRRARPGSRVTARRAAPTARIPARRAAARASTARTSARSTSISRRSPPASASKTDADRLFCPGQSRQRVPGIWPAASAAPPAARITRERRAGGPSSRRAARRAATLASVFCIAATGNGLVDASADLPGPGAVSLPGAFIVHN